MTPKRWAAMFLSVVLCAGLSFAAEPKTYAPAFSLRNSQQKVRTLKSFRGHVVFIDFWASWCAPCRLELPEADRLAGELKKKGVRVLAVNVDTDRKAAKALLAQLGLARPKFEVLWDPAFRAARIPIARGLREL